MFGDNQGAGTIINDDSGTIVTTATFQVQAGGDDVTEEAGGFTANASTVWVGSGETASTSYAGFRFNGVPIPPGAVISSARLELRSASNQWLTTAFEFGIEAAVNSAPFSAASRPSQRTLLTPRVQHSSNVQWLADTWYQLDQLASLLQPLVNQPGWAPGNAVSLVVRGGGQNWARKFATAFEGGAAFAPRLVVTYSYVEGSQPSLSIADVSVTEGNSGSANTTFTVSLSAPVAQVVTASWATANGTATAGSDFTASSGTVTFPANSSAPQTVTVPILGDTTVEPDETFVVNLTGPTNATIADGQATGTITNDDAAPPSVSVAIADAAQAEGNAGPAAMAFTLTLSAASTQIVTVNASTADGTAAAGSDYVALAATPVTFPAGSTSQTVAVTVNSDTVAEANENFSVTLSGATNATIGDGTAQGTITNDDGVPGLAINDVAVTEGVTPSAVFTVTLAAASGLQVTVAYATANETATSGADYTTTTGTLTFAPGTTTQTIPVPIADDALAEGVETFLVNLSGPVNASLGDATGQGTITSNDAVPSLAITSPVLTEGDAGAAPLTFTVTLSAASGQTVTVNYAAASGSATLGTDFAAASGTLTFDPGETSKPVPVQVSGDLLDEANETFTVTLSGPSNASLGTPAGTGTITDNDPTPTLSINDAGVNEGNAGTTPAAFTVSLSAASGQTVTVVYTATSGTAQAGSDFAAESATLTFAPGVTSQAATIDLTGDTSLEADETFTVVLSAPANATIADGTGQGTIVNDDGVPTLAIGDVTVAEAAGSATFTVTLSEAGGQPVTVTYATSGGSATSGSDFTPTSGTLTFPSSTVTQTFAVPVAADTLSEAAESFTVTLSLPVNATIADGTATGSITDDDPLPVLSIGDASGAEGNSGTTNLVFTVTLTPASGQSVTVSHQTANGTAAAPADFTAASGSLTFAPGETTKTVPVVVIGETGVEPDETFSVSLSAPANATTGDATGAGTIVNDDLSSLSIGPVSVAEGDSGSTSANFTVTLSAASSQTVTVNYAAAGVTATAGTDFTLTPGTATFAPGVTTQTIAVAVVGETLFEANETYTVTLSGATGASIGTPSATGTITNDDTVPSMSITGPSIAEGNSGGDGCDLHREPVGGQRVAGDGHLRDRRRNGDGRQRLHGSVEHRHRARRLDQRRGHGDRGWRHAVRSRRDVLGDAERAGQRDPWRRQWRGDHHQ